ncbi:Plasmodium exported protein (Pm-fam-a like), unknown function [Plasmodium malariae]|uniref:Fam-l protein n=1 Tax=Plasmodium malariae TaxID=5858 RepID=A0A1A8X0K7_PLAMA|nr:Plasmodium exported protein (Pm-fam-a like), unknown function [Plasmodium malariae]
MEQSIKFSKFNKFLGDNYGSDRKLNKRLYRLLGKCEKVICSHIGDLELKIPYNKKEKNEKLITIDNEKWDEEIKEKLYRSSLIKKKLIKRLMKNKYSMFHNSYNYYEKKVMNGLNDKSFFKKMILINDKDYKKLKRRKYGLRIFIFFLLFVVVLMIPILDLSIGNLLILLFQLLENSAANGSSSPSTVPVETADSSWSSYFSQNPFVLQKARSILMYCVPILLLSIILILGIFHYYKKVIKRKKIKSLETFNEW